MVRIAPSILSADFATLADAMARVEGHADLLHVDVMDGHFVPNLTIGPPVVKSLRRHTRLYLDCHLMMTNPGDYLEAFAKAGANGCTVHVEVGDTAELLIEARRLGLDAGLAANPATPLEAYAPFLGDIDLMLVMTVVPGFGGQSFMAEVLPKIAATAQMIEERGFVVPVQVDGGIDESTAPKVVAAGASILVAGQAIFGDPDPAAATDRVRAAAASAIAAR